MPPKKRNPESEGAQQTKRRKKKKDEDDFIGDEEIGNNGASSFLEDEASYGGASIDITLEGSMLNGELLFCGGTNWDLIGRHTIPKGGALFLWGQTKPTGEAAMYPKLVQDLSGWRVRSIGCCNKSIVIAADESVVSWGPSPTYGELGYGDSKPRSSSTPQEVKTMDGIYVHTVACGYGHAMFIARCDNEAEKERIEKLPVFTP